MYRALFRTALLTLLIATAFVGQSGARAQIIDDVDEFVEHALVQFHSHFDLTGEEPIMEMAIVAVYITDSEEIAEQMYQETVGSFEDDDDVRDLLLSDWEGVGDEALTGSFTEDDNTLSFAIARENNILALSITVATDEISDIPAGLVTYILEAGPSDSDISYDSEGNASGGWADAFPSAGDVDAISHMESGDVFDLFSMDDQGIIPPS